eukprot:1194855-Amphidinium_carterae.1
MLAQYVLFENLGRPAHAKPNEATAWILQPIDPEACLSDVWFNKLLQDPVPMLEQLDTLRALAAKDGEARLSNGLWIRVASVSERMVTLRHLANHCRYGLERTAYRH